MRSALTQALSDRALAARQKDGARFIRAMESISFDLGVFDPFVKGSTVSADIAKSALTKLYGSLQSDRSEAA